MKLQQTNQQLLTPAMMQDMLPVRAHDAHKGQHGSVAMIGGDAGMAGAVLLAARSALLAGAGRVYAAMLCQNAPTVDVNYPEIMLRSPEVLGQLSQLDCVVIGTGLGQTNMALNLLAHYLTQAIPMLLDADALNLVAQNPHLVTLIRNRTAETVITPHVGEAARLLGIGRDEIQSNRSQSALQLAQTLHVSCVLKCAGSVCAHHDGTWLINPTGNAGLASGGTGDVLSGIIGSLIAQGLTGFNAAKVGVYVHGAAADALLAKGIGPIGLRASEVALEVRNIINELTRTKIDGNSV